MRGRIIFIEIVFALIVFITGLSLGVAEELLPEPGPENQGLRLRLAISNPTKPEKDEHLIRLELLNVGRDQVTLFTDWEHDNQKGDYADFLKSRVVFLTWPEFDYLPRQGFMPTRTLPQYQHELKLGSSILTEWKTVGHYTHGLYDYGKFYLPMSGLYQIHAQIVVKTKNGDSVFLRSNEQPFIVGGNISMPKHTRATVLSTNSKNNTVVLDRGQNHKIRKNDIFFISPSKLFGWRLKVTKVWGDISEAEVEFVEYPFPFPGFPEQKLSLEIKKEIFPKKVEFPAKGDIAELYLPIKNQNPVKD